MAASYIPFEFTSGTYRAKLRVSYEDAFGSGGHKDSDAYLFTETRTIEPPVEPGTVKFNIVNFTEVTSGSEVFNNHDEVSSYVKVTYTSNKPFLFSGISTNSSSSYYNSTTTQYRYDVPSLASTTYHPYHCISESRVSGYESTSFETDEIRNSMSGTVRAGMRMYVFYTPNVTENISSSSTITFRTRSVTTESTIRYGVSTESRSNTLRQISFTNASYNRLSAIDLYDGGIQISSSYERVYNGTMTEIVTY